VNVSVTVTVGVVIAIAVVIENVAKKLMRRSADLTKVKE
jgi:hypothetical protein